MFKKIGILLFIATLTSGAHAERIKIAVSDIEYRAMESSENKRLNSYGRGVKTDTRAFIDMVTTALVKTNKFDVVERDRMGQILAEQGMTMEGILSNEAGIESMRLGGVDYVLTGSITEYGKTKSSLGGSRFSMGGEVTKMSVDIRVLDVENGNIRIADTVERSLSASGAFKTNKFNMGSEGNESGAMGDIMRLTAKGIVNVIVSSIYPVRIVKISGDSVYLNYGDGLMSVNDLYDVIEEGEEITDPDTGETLGSTRERKGQVEITDAQPRFSIATVVDGEVGKGMILVQATKRVTKKKKKSLFKR